MASAARASSASRHQAQARRPSNIMTASGQGASIFASIINSEEDFEDNAGDQEIQNITTFHSPLEGLYRFLEFYEIFEHFSFAQVLMDREL